MHEMSFANIVKDVPVDGATLDRDMATIAPSDKNYIIFFTPRSGSSWLTSILSATEKLGYPEVYVNPAFVRDVVKTTNARTPELLIKMLRRKCKTSNGVFGIEVRAIDVSLFGEREFFGEVDPATVIYCLWRGNTVARGISLYRAGTTGRFHSSEEKVPPARAYSATDIRYWIQDVANAESANLRMLEQHNLTARFLCYEDLVGDCSTALSLFAEPLGVSLDAAEPNQQPSDGLTKIADAWNFATEVRFRRE